jgi:hypothetical protein
MTFTLDFSAAYEWFMALSTPIQFIITIVSYLVIGTIIAKVLYAWSETKTREAREFAMFIVLAWGIFLVLALPGLVYIAIKYFVTGKGLEE